MYTYIKYVQSGFGSTATIIVHGIQLIIVKFGPRLSRKQERYQPSSDDETAAD